MNFKELSVFEPGCQLNDKILKELLDASSKEVISGVLTRIMENDAGNERRMLVVFDKNPMNFRWSSTSKKMGLAFKLAEEVTTTPNPGFIDKLLLKGEHVGLFRHEGEMVYYRGHKSETNHLSFFVVSTNPVDAMPIMLQMQDNAKKEHAELHKVEQELVKAQKDPLTGLPGRGHELEAFKGHVNWAKRAGGDSQVGIAFFDIDKFKGVNDAFGHDVGDIVLKHVAGILGGSVRSHDDVFKHEINTSMFRHGGEEFLLMLECKNEAEAIKAVDRLRATVERTPCPLSREDYEKAILNNRANLDLAIGKNPNNLSKIDIDALREVRQTLKSGLEDGDKTGNYSLGITVSGGISTYFPNGGDIRTALEEAITVADTCLYRAKRDGRNRIVSNSKRPNCPAEHYGQPTQGKVFTPDGVK